MLTRILVTGLIAGALAVAAVALVRRRRERARAAAGPDEALPRITIPWGIVPKGVH